MLQMSGPGEGSLSCRAMFDGTSGENGASKSDGPAVTSPSSSKTSVVA